MSEKREQVEREIDSIIGEALARGADGYLKASIGEEPNQSPWEVCKELREQILSIPELAEGLKLYELYHTEWKKGKPPIRFPSPDPY